MLPSREHKTARKAWIFLNDVHWSVDVLCQRVLFGNKRLAGSCLHPSNELPHVDLPARVMFIKSVRSHTFDSDARMCVKTRLGVTLLRLNAGDCPWLQKLQEQHGLGRAQLDHQCSRCEPDSP